MPEPKPSSPPILWPAEWSQDEKFWREVGTRTLAGVLTLVIIGIPALVATAMTGTLDGQTLLSIAIGVGISAVILIVYIAVYRVATREPTQAYQLNVSEIARLNETLRSVESENAGSGSAMKAKELREAIEQATEDEQKNRRSIWKRTILSMLASVSAGVAATIISYFLT